MEESGPSGFFHFASVKMDSKFIQGGDVSLVHNAHPECMQLASAYLTVSCGDYISRKGRRKVTTKAVHAACNHGEGDETERGAPQETEGFDDPASGER